MIILYAVIMQAIGELGLSIEKPDEEQYSKIRAIFDNTRAPFHK